MAQRKFQKNFIPRTSGVSPSVKRTIDHGGMGLPMLVSIIIFLTTTALALGIFLFEQYLEGSIEEKKTTLSQETEKIDQKEIEKFVDLDNRLRSVKGIVNGHWALSNFFSILEEDTLDKMQFSNFAIIGKENRDAAEVSMTGVSDNFGIAAVQADTLRQDQNIKDTLFADISVNEVTDEGGFSEKSVEFNVGALIKPEVVLYRDVLETPESVDGEQEEDTALEPDFGDEEPVQEEDNQVEGENI